MSVVTFHQNIFDVFRDVYSNIWLLAALVVTDFTVNVRHRVAVMGRELRNYNQAFNIQKGDFVIIPILKRELEPDEQSVQDQLISKVRVCLRGGG